MNYAEDIKTKYGKELYIDCLKNYFEGEDIYVIASGKSCDFVDPSFFDNKITIGVNIVFCRFNTTFLIRKENSILELVENLELPSIHILSVGDCGGSNRRNLDYYKKNPAENVFLFNHKLNKLTGISAPDLEKNELVVSFSTITSAIHLAAFLGAKNVILLGHDCGTIDGESNFKSYLEFRDDKMKVSLPFGKNKDEYKKWYDNWLKQIEDQTIWTKRMLKKKYDTNVYSLNPFINFNLEGHKYK